MALIIRNGRNPWGMRPSDMFDEMLRSWEEDREIRGVAANIYETADEVVAEMEVPGVKPEDIAINVTGDTLTVSGESREEQEEKKRSYYQKQLRYGSFAQSVMLPAAVQADKAEAHFQHGVLKVVLPKAEEAKPKKIEVKVKA